MKEVITQICNELHVTRNEAELIAAALLDTPRYKLYLDDTINRSEKCKLFMRIDQLKHGVPIEYLTKKVMFRDNLLTIVPGVFIPRNETEYFIDLIVGENNTHPNMIADIGTGTGAIAITLARCFPSSTVIATEIAASAIECAHMNVRHHDLNDRIHIIKTDILDGVDHVFDLIVSNPPYIPISRLQSLPKSVKCYEPMCALNGGKQGIMFTKKMIDRCWSLVNDDGLMAIEIDEDAVQALEKVLHHYPSVKVSFHKDLNHAYRYMFLRKVQ